MPKFKKRGKLSQWWIRWHNQHIHLFHWAYVVRHWAWKRFSKYEPECNRRCMEQEDCANRSRIMVCGECWRGSNLKRNKTEAAHE